ncbi:hypothetical protein [Methylocystis echinoides]|uniref:hypothetical protein n=1 Tax=Methylocystis echinoides TaxID=29468 RepID=UPI002492B2B1|nr:hypothetical protein [Methylocystis echinoides]
MASFITRYVPVATAAPAKFTVVAPFTVAGAFTIQQSNQILSQIIADAACRCLEPTTATVWPMLN